MRLTRSFIDAPLTIGRQVALDEAATTHLVRVLRLGLGDAIVLFNGDGHDYEARLTGIAKRGAEAEVMSRRAVDNESPLRLVLAQAVARGEKMDWVLQKATELGVTELVPLFTERCEVRLDAERSDKRLQHWRGVIASACEQSGRAVLPMLHAPASLADWLMRFAGKSVAGNVATDPVRAATDLIVYLDPQAEATLRDLPADVGFALVIGPEGGLGERDLAQLRAAGARGIRLGPRVLRTETAGIAAIAALQALRGDVCKEQIHPPD